MYSETLIHSTCTVPGLGTLSLQMPTQLRKQNIFRTTPLNYLEERFQGSTGLQVGSTVSGPC